MSSRFLRSFLTLGLVTAALAAQPRAPLQSRVALDSVQAHLHVIAQGAPNSTMVLMFATRQLLPQGIQTPWGLLCLDPSAIVATVPIQLDGQGRAQISAPIARPYDPFVITLQAGMVGPTGLALTNPVAFAGAAQAANAGTVLTYSGGTFTGSADGVRGDTIEVKTDDGTVLGRGAVQQDGQAVNLGGTVPAGTQWIGLYRNGVLISWVRC